MLDKVGHQRGRYQQICLLPLSSTMAGRPALLEGRGRVMSDISVLMPESPDIRGRLK
jgi:hypothetical protein